MQQKLGEIVALKVNPKKGDMELARRFGIRGYPTMVFTDGGGNEVDRIDGYLPPKPFLQEFARIRSGDTVAAHLAQLDANPGDVDALRPAVEGLLARGDAAAAVLRIKEFREHDPAASDSVWSDLAEEAGWRLQSSLYRSAARALVNKDGEVPVVPEEAQASALAELLADPKVAEGTPQEIAVQLHQARYDDAGRLLDDTKVDQVPVDRLLELADEAFSTGHYQRAADAYLRWDSEKGADASADQLNQIAWSLYEAKKSLDDAVAIARRAVAADPSPGVADTLARLLYVTGHVDEAVTVESKAAEDAGESEADAYRKVVAQMKAGEDLGDKPSFEGWPKVPESAPAS